MSTQPVPARLAQIDGLRAIAALSVLLFHYTTRYNELFLHVEPIPLQFPYGYLGVNLFFGISGFVILMTLDRAAGPLNFLVARLARLFPTYWAAVALTWAIVTAMELPGYVVTQKEAILNLSMIHSFFGVKDVDGVYWTLQVELLYYAWMLAASVAGALRRPYLAIGAWTAISLLRELYRLAMGSDLPWAVTSFLLIDWIPWFAIGMSAYLRYRGGASRAYLLVTTVACATVLLRGQLPEAVAVIATALLLRVASSGRFALLGSRPFVFAGGISYPLYLVHEKIGWATISRAEALQLNAWAGIAAATLLSVSIAVVLHRFVEEPGRATIRRTLAASLSRVGAVDTRGRAAWLAGSILFVATLGAAAVLTGRSASAARSELSEYVLNVPSGRGHDCGFEEMDSKALVLIALGQSNAGSHAEKHGSDEFASVYHRGRCFDANDPLPGTTGAGASIWTALYGRLRAERPERRIVIAPLAIGGSEIAQWVEGGRIQDDLQELLRGLAFRGAHVSAILWQQGEADAQNGFPAGEYRQALLALRSQIDATGISAPLIVARSTICGQQPPYEPLRRAIVAAAAADARIIVGPDTDSLGTRFRYDSCHFNKLGRHAAAELWQEALAKELVRSSER